LPLAAQFAGKGHRVFGCDINPSVVEMVARGDAYPDEAGLGERVRAAVDSGRLSAQTATTDAVRQAEVIVVIVPLVVDRNKQIDYRAIDSATADVAAGLQRGSLVVYETTLPVGDTRTRFGPVLERGSGLQAGREFSLAFSPERVFVGRIFQDLERYPKVVGGIDEESTRKAATFYRSVLDSEVLVVANAETAEFTKLAETTYRDVNIALANEFAMYAEEIGVNAMQAIDAANTQPFSHIHRPGIGVGGHCIPVYPYFYANHTRHAEIARLARRINDGMADHAIERLENSLGELTDRTVAVLGYAYREDVKEVAFTVAERLVKRLRDRDARVLVHDPMFAPEELRRQGLEPYSLARPEPVDALVVQAGHAVYRSLGFGKIPGLQVLVDGRNVVDPVRVPPGVRYLAIGRGER
jgi:nucleotide sugar dehydrogenase